MIISYPESGATLVLENPAFIKWDGKGLTGKGKIELIYGNDEYIGDIASDVTLSNGRIDWNVGILYRLAVGVNGLMYYEQILAKPKNGYRVRLKAANGNVLDITGFITLALLKVIDSSIPDALWVGNLYHFDWESWYIPGEIVFKIVRKGFGSSPYSYYEQILEKANDEYPDKNHIHGGIGVIIPDVAPGDDYYIVISAMDGEWYYYSHKLSVSKIGVIEPISKSKWCSGDYLPISWYSSPAPYFRIDLLKGEDVVKNIFPIIQGSSGEQSRSMMLSKYYYLDPGNDYKVRVIALDTDGNSAESDENGNPTSYADSERFTIFPTEVELNFSTHWAGKEHHFRYEWGIGRTLDTMGEGPIPVEYPYFIVGYENWYESSYYVVYGEQHYLGWVYRGAVLVDPSPFNKWLKDGIEISSITMSIYVREIVKEGDEATTPGFAAKGLCLLDGPWIGFDTKFTWIDAMPPFDTTEKGYYGKDIDITYYVLDPFSKKPLKNSGVVFKGPNETMLSNPDACHNNNKFYTIYGIRRVWATLKRSH
jgi:hypothetical protein